MGAEADGPGVGTPTPARFDSAPLFYTPQLIGFFTVYGNNASLFGKAPSA
jgi:hypothetical protein